MNKTTLISIAVFFVTGFIIGTQMRGCHGAKTTEVKSIHSDTIMRYTRRTDTLYRTIATYRPAPMQIIRGIHDTSVITQSSPVSCADTLRYSDSVYRAEEFKAVISDIITGNRIARRSIQWADLAPVAERTITNTITLEKKQPIAKVYIGASVGVRYATPMLQGGIDIAPSGSVILADRYMIDVCYYVLGGQITAGAKIKLSFKK